MVGGQILQQRGAGWVLFDGCLQASVVTAIAAAPSTQPPIEVIGAAMERAARLRSAARRHPSLQERELLKLPALDTTAAAALRDRGVPEPAASLTAQLGITVFKVAFEQWIGDRPDFPACVRATLDHVKARAGDAG